MTIKRRKIFDIKKRILKLWMNLLHAILTWNTMQLLNYDQFDKIQYEKFAKLK